MAERPIIFSAPMVRAILGGRKTQTRRVLKPQPSCAAVQSFEDDDGIMRWVPNPIDRPADEVPLPVRFAVGDLLWVRESTHIDGKEVNYMADFPGNPKGLGWRPSIHMPRWASRITLKVTDVRVERLQAISGDDCDAEGIESDVWDMCVVYRDYTGTEDDWFYTWPGAFKDDGKRYVPMDDAEGIQRRSFRSLWERINGTGSWDANPWVAAISFERVATPDTGEGR